MVVAQISESSLNMIIMMMMRWGCCVSSGNDQWILILNIIIPGWHPYPYPIIFCIYFSNHFDCWWMFCEMMDGSVYIWRILLTNFYYRWLCVGISLLISYIMHELTSFLSLFFTECSPPQSDCWCKIFFKVSAIFLPQYLARTALSMFLQLTFSHLAVIKRKKVP